MARKWDVNSPTFRGFLPYASFSARYLLHRTRILFTGFVAHSGARVYYLSTESYFSDVPLQQRGQRAASNFIAHQSAVVRLTVLNTVLIECEEAQFLHEQRRKRRILVAR